MQRLADWWPRLQAVVTAFDGQPFVWGATDCACFAAACVEAVTGRDVMATYRGEYTCRLTAKGRMHGRDHRTLAIAARAAIADVSPGTIEPVFARVGDIGITADHVLCVRLPVGFVARGADGTLRTAHPVTAWQIGA